MKSFWILLAMIAVAPAEGATTDDLLHRLSSPQPAVRIQAQQELDQLPVDAKRALLPFMTEQLKGADNVMRANALTYFANAGPTFSQPVLPQVLEALKDPSPDIRSRAADVVGSLGPAAQDAGPVLLEMIMNDKDAGVQSHAANAVQFLGAPGHNPTLDHLGQKLADPDQAVRLQATRSLLKIGLGAQQTAPALIAALQDEDLQVKRYAAFALAAMHAAPTEALPVLIHALASKTLSGMAGVALYQIGKPAVPPLIQALSSESIAERKGAILALQRLGPQATDAIPALTHALEDKDTDIQKAASKALAAIQSSVPTK